MIPRNTTIDLAKFVAALLVVAIHTVLFSDVNDILYFVFNEVVCRLGVPFFAVCSGYFFCKGMSTGGTKTLIKSERKLIRIYALWTVLYYLFLLPNWIQIDYFSLASVIGYLKSSLLSGSYFHLWYVLYVIYALPVFYLILKYFGRKMWLCCSIGLWGIYALGYGYSSILPLSISHLLGYTDFYAPVSAQFVILPLLLLGAYLCDRKEKGDMIKKNLTFLTISFLFLLVEGSVLKYRLGLEGVTRIFMILPVSYFLFSLLLGIQIKSISFKYFGKMSLIIYCIHPMKYINTAIQDSISAYLIVCILSASVSLAWLWFSNEKNYYLNIL